MQTTIDPARLFVPLEYRDGYTVPHERLDNDEALSCVIPLGATEFPSEKVTERLGACYAGVAEFAILGYWPSYADSKILVVVQRGDRLSRNEGWHDDGSVHDGRITISDQLPTLFEDRDTHPWEITSIGPTERHSPSPNPHGFVRTMMKISRYTELQNNQ